MATIRIIENIKLGVRITLINGIYAILLGIAQLSIAGIIIGENFRAIDISWGFFERYNPKISSLFYKDIILAGLFMIAIGACIIYLSTDISKRKEKVPWMILFIMGIIFWSSLLTMEIFKQNWLTAIPAVIGWLSFIVGMIIPIRYYLGNPYEEY